MDDNIILEPSTKSATENETPVTKDADANTDVDPDSKYVPEQVFDISSDLNISPVDDDPPLEANSASITFKAVAPAAISIIKPEPIPGPMVQPISTTTGSIQSTIPKPAVMVSEEVKIKTIPPQIKPVEKEPDVTTTNVDSEGHIIEGLRTYESDVAKLISTRGTSAVNMIMAEKRKEAKKETAVINKGSPTSHTKEIIMFTSVALILIGLAGAYYFYSISPFATVTPPVQQSKVNPIVPSDSQITMSIDGLDSNRIISSIRNIVQQKHNPGTIIEIIPYTTDSNNIKSRVIAQQMIKNMKIPAPDTLSRSLTPSWMLGVYTDKNNTKNVFVVITNNFFQNAFAGMLSWENVMPDDFKQYLFSVTPLSLSNTKSPENITPANNINSLQNIESILSTSTQSSTSTARRAQATTTLATTTIATTTSSTTPIEIPKPVIPYFSLRGQFQDKIVRNKDVREFIATTGTTVFLYSFIDNNHTVITTNEATLAEILTRLERQAYIR